jgi:hypothetical protein
MWGRLETERKPLQSFLFNSFIQPSPNEKGEKYGHKLPFVFISINLVMFTISDDKSLYQIKQSLSAGSIDLCGFHTPRQSSNW